jgi:hypothetical protein
MFNVTQTSPGEREEIRDRIARYERDAAQLAATREKLLDAHPEEWVAVHAGLTYHARDLDGLLSELRSAGIDPARVPIEFLSRENPPLLL